MLEQVKESVRGLSAIFLKADNEIDTSLNEIPELNNLSKKETSKIGVRDLVMLKNTRNAVDKEGKIMFESRTGRKNQKANINHKKIQVESKKENNKNIVIEKSEEIDREEER